MEKRHHADEEEVNSPDVKKLKESLSEDFGGDESNTEERSSEDPAALVKTLGEEITDPPSSELGFLLEASDDELGLLPPVQGGEPVPGAEFWEGPCYEYDGFGRFGFDEPDDFGVLGAAGDDDYCVALDGLFDYSDTLFGSGEVLWKPGFETLPAQ